MSYTANLFGQQSRMSTVRAHSPCVLEPAIGRLDPNSRIQLMAAGFLRCAEAGRRPGVARRWRKLSYANETWNLVRRARFVHRLAVDWPGGIRRFIHCPRSGGKHAVVRAFRCAGITGADDC